MAWTVQLSPEFSAWLDSLAEGDREAITVDLRVLQEFGPSLGRPHVDTLKDSRHPNMKELRTAHAGHQYRSLFAFDPLRRAIVLAGGDKVGRNQRRFYETAIRDADAIFDRHLCAVAAAKKKEEAEKKAGKQAGKPAPKSPPKKRKTP